MKKLRFAVLGDTHFCEKKTRGLSGGGCPIAELPDHIRYSDMVDTVLSPLFAKIRALKPDFVLSTGDFVEGCMSDREKTFREMRAGWSFMKKLGCPCFIARGTHENPEAYREIVVPEISKFAGKKLDRAYYSFEFNGVVFLMLDYQDWSSGNEQDLWLESELRKHSFTARRIFIAAHPPLYSWGRHFFNEPAFIKRMISLCEKYPVDAYFCGHTHNQSVSFHERDKGGGNCFLQIKCSTVGYPGSGTPPLDDFHAPAEFTKRDHLLWGVPEDFAPGFYLVETDGEKTSVKWMSVDGDSASLTVKKRFGRPLHIKRPRYKRAEHGITGAELNQIKSAWLYIYGIYPSPEKTELFFNGVPSGRLPPNTVYAARRLIHLSSGAVASIREDNTVETQPPPEGDFVIGSVSLELILLDNRVIRTRPAPELFVRGERWSQFPPPRAVIKTAGEKRLSLTLKFEKLN
jgi:hypothetical protein